MSNVSLTRVVSAEELLALDELYTAVKSFERSLFFCVREVDLEISRALHTALEASLGTHMAADALMNFLDDNTDMTLLAGFEYLFT